MVDTWCPSIPEIKLFQSKRNVLLLFSTTVVTKGIYSLLEFKANQYLSQKQVVSVAKHLNKAARYL